MRKQVLAGVSGVAVAVGESRPQILFGVGQGALVALCCCRPLLVEVACRARTLTAGQLYRIRAAWGGLVSIFAIAPIILHNNSTLEIFLAAVPEFCFEQPLGLQISVTADTSKAGKPAFVRGLCEKINIQPWKLEDLKDSESGQGATDAS